jgi:hypothetical protein
VLYVGATLIEIDSAVILFYAGEDEFGKKEKQNLIAGVRVTDWRVWGRRSIYTNHTGIYAISSR